MKLLLVEDNYNLAEDLSKFFQENGFIVESVTLLEEAREKVDLYEYDMVIIDIGLPDGSGLDLVEEIKGTNSETGILILTAKDSLEDKVKGLDLGADDYLTKPFHKSELNARLRSIMRRNKFQGNNVLEMEEITIDFTKAEAYVNGKLLKLTKKEYDLLVYFVQNPERLLTKENIAEHLWGDHIDQADSFDFVYNHIKNLRKKITDAGGRNYIKASYGMGYKFSKDE